MSRWMASPKNALVLRKFSTVNARTLLYLQHEIAKREETLSSLDEQSMAQRSYRGSFDDFETDVNTERGRLMVEMPRLLDQYYSLVNSFAQVRSIPPARSEHVENLQTWIATHPNTTSYEKHYPLNFEHRDDMFSIAPPSQVPLRKVLENCLELVSRFKTPEPATSGTDPKATRLDDLTKYLASLMGMMLLFGPMWSLLCASDDALRLGIICTAIVAFGGWLWAAVSCSSFERLGATAAYAAVLMVYMQNSC